MGICLVDSCKTFTLLQFSSVAQLYPTLCDPINRSMPGLCVHHQLPEFTQTHAHRVGDAIQPSHPLSSPSPPAPNPSQHQGVFQWVNSSHKVAKVLEFQLLENMKKIRYLSNIEYISRNRHTDIENKCRTPRKQRGVGWIGRLELTYIHCYV